MNWVSFRQPLRFRLFFWISAIFTIILATTQMSPTAIAQTSGPAKIQFVSPAWAADHLKDSKLKILDVRTAPLDYIDGHLPGAVNIADTNFRGPNGFLPFQIWDPNKLASLFSRAGISNSDTVLVYSDGRDILGSTLVAYLLERSGVKDIAVLDGGFSGYKAAGLPVTKEYPRYTEGKFQPHDKRALRVDLNQVRGLIGNPKVVFLDPRPADLFSGEKKVFIRNGHIPGAHNQPWPTFTQADNPDLKNPHQLKPLPDLQKLLAAKGIGPEDDVIVTCSTGREATLQYVVLKHLLGYPKVRIYEGSWTEYSATDLPVETGPGKSA